MELHRCRPTVYHVTRYVSMVLSTTRSNTSYESAITNDYFLLNLQEISLQPNVIDISFFINFKRTLKQLKAVS